MTTLYHVDCSMRLIWGRWWRVRGISQSLLVDNMSLKALCTSNTISSWHGATGLVHHVRSSKRVLDVPPRITTGLKSKPNAASLLQGPLCESYDAVQISGAKGCNLCIVSGGCSRPGNLSSDVTAVREEWLLKGAEQYRLESERLHAVK